MSLTTAINIGIRSLEKSQESIAIASHNLANVSTPDYIRQKPIQEALVVAGSGRGAIITGIQAEVNRNLAQTIRSDISSLHQYETLSNLYDSIVRIYGEPGTNDSVTNAIAKFFSDYQSLSNNPATPSLRLTAVSSGKDLANKISEITSQLHDLRLAADQDISTAIKEVNSALTKIDSFNTEILKFEERSSGYVNINQQMTANLKKISEHLNIKTTFDEKGRVTITTGNGVSLIDSANLTKLEYSNATSVETFKNDSVLNALKATILNQDGTASSTSSDLVTSGKSSAITTSLTDGSIYGFVQMRDNLIPNLITQLDTLANTITDEVNALHNNGFGFPPPSSLTGTTATTSNTEVNFTGKVRIAVVKNDGTPAPSPYTDEATYRPLTIDLSTLDSGSGAGRSNVQTFIDEINDYFGPVQNRASVGNLRDIKLVATSSSISDAGTAQFDLELDSISARNSTVVLQSVTVIDPIDSTSTYPASTLPTPNSYTVTAGDRVRTAIPLTVNFGAGDDNRTSYTIRVRAQVTDANGTVSVADIDYTVSDNVTGIKNDRYVAQALTSVSGTSTFHVAPTSSSFASAALVDANGVAVGAGTLGYLKLTTTSGQNYSIIIDELDSKEVGVPGADTSTITNRGFSHYFGLNNIFVEHATTAGSALNMQLRSDILTNPNLLTTGKLVLSNQPADPNSALYTYEAGSGNNSGALAIAQLDKKSVFFAASGGLPAISTTFGKYGSNITGTVATAAIQNESVKASKQVSLDGSLDELAADIEVNIDEELGYITIVQNEYIASARAISLVTEMLDELFRI